MTQVTLKDGTSLYTIDQGSGRPLLIVNALMFTADYYWRKNIDALAAGNRLIFPDMRGQGRSAEGSKGPYNIPQLADDIDDILTQLDLDDVVLGGLAIGAIAILDYVKRYGTGRLSKVVLMDFTPRPKSIDGWEHPTFGNFPAEMADGYAPAVRGDRNILQDFIRGSFTEPLSDEDFDKLWEESLLTPTDVCAEYIESLVNADYRDAVPMIDKPTLLLYGGSKNATLPTPIGEWMRDQITDATLVKFEDSGHCPFIQEPEKFNQILGEFAAT